MGTSTTAPTRVTERIKGRRGLPPAGSRYSGGLAEAIGFGIGGGLIGIVVLPIFYGIVGLIFGLISAALYNVVARLVGGIRIETS